jgi:hypothetical protein
MVCPANSSYSFRDTALIFCRMFIHIIEVCMSTGFWWSGGGIICVLQTHFIFFKKISPNKTTLSIIIKWGGILFFLVFVWFFSFKQFNFCATSLFCSVLDQSCFLLYWYYHMVGWVMEVSATFNNMSAILWWSVLLVEETGVPRESHWQTLSHNVVVSSTH